MIETSRRDLFRRLAGRAASAAGERIPALDTQRSPSATALAVPPAPSPAPARCALSDAGLAALTETYNLAARANLVRDLARVSWRLVEPGDDAADGSRLGWTWGVDRIDDTGHLHLGTLHLGAFTTAYGHDAAAAATGDVAILIPAETPPLADGGPMDAGRVRAVPGTPARTAASASAVPEVVLPRPWSAVVQAAGLDAVETDAWAELREAVADAQAVTLFDTTTERLSLHRAFGYPDERNGLMAERCATDGAAGPWCLLLQLTLDAVPGRVRWPEGRHRLYLWITEPALAAGDFSAVRGFFQ